MYEFRVAVTWAAVLAPTWLYAPLWLMAAYAPWPYFGLGFLTPIYIFGQTMIYLFAKNSKYI